MFGLSSRTHAEVVSGQAELLSSMEEMKNLINGLRRKTSTLSLRSMASFAPSINTKEAMKQLCKNLYKAGVRADMIRDREDLALALFQDPNTPPVASQEENHQTAGLAVHSEKPLEGQIAESDGSVSGMDPPLRGSALHAVAQLGLKRGVKFLLANGADIESMRSYHGATPLDAAAYFGHIDVVRLLLEKGANIEATRSTNGSTPLDAAAYNGHTDVVGLLLDKGANIEATRSDVGATPLDVAADKGHTDVVRLLLGKGANIEAMRSGDGSTPLDTAAYNGHTDVVRLLLEKGANIEATRSDDGATPLYTASWRGHVGVVSLLLEKGANTEATRSDNERTALHAAASYLQTDVVQLLLEKGANIHAVTKQAETVLHVVFDVFSIHSDSKQLIPTIKVLLANGANILQKDDNGKTPLDLAEKGGHSKAKNLFLRHIKEYNLKSPRKA